MGDFFQTLRSLLGLEETPDQKRLRESLERPKAKQGVPPMLARPKPSPAFLGEAPQQRSIYRDGSALMPPPLSKISNPMEWMGEHEMQRNLSKADKPGATVVDFRPGKHMTPEEHEAMRYQVERGGKRTYFPDPEATVFAGDIPEEAMFLGPLKSSSQAGKISHSPSNFSITTPYTAA